MEFADGGDLYQKINLHKEKKKYFEEDEIWNVLIQIARALNILHDMKIYHRDLKVPNRKIICRVQMYFSLKTVGLSLEI